MEQPNPVATLQQWADWADAWAPPRASRSDWSAVDSFVTAAEPRLRENSKALLQLLERSQDQLRFTDPLLCDLGLHRWLGKDREEAYSDWLAWVLQQLGEADAVLRVLGVQNTKFVARTYRVEREAFVEEGAPGCEGRIDLLIHFGEPERAILGVEVKTWDQSYEKQAGYLKSLQKPDLPAECVLVAIEVPRDGRFGFTLRSWQDLCMALRREIGRSGNGHDSDIIKAMMLGFVGAIEQNLLEFGTAASRRARDKQATLVSRKLLEHLSETVEVAMSTETQNSILAVGSKSYLNALAAVEAFEQEVEDLCAGAYRRHEERLLSQMGLDAHECERHSLPSPEDREAEIGACRPAQKGGCRFYVYLWWRDSEARSPEVVGAVALDLSTKKLRDDIWNRFHSKNPNCSVERDVGDYYFLFLTAPIDLSTRSGTSEALDQLVSEWLGYCESIGGLKLFG